MKISLVYLLHTKVCQTLSFQQRVGALLVAMVVIQLLLVAGFFHQTLSETLQDQISTKALIQAREIATDPHLITLIQQNNLSELQAKVERLQGISDANYIVIGDINGIRIAHPEKEKNGLPMEGGDSQRALKDGEYYTSTQKGSLGWAIRGKAAIVAPSGDILGVVSVGYLLDYISDWLHIYSHPMLTMIALLMLISGLSAWLFTRHIKQQMFNMEPEEIAMNLNLQQSILQGVYEGIVAISSKGEILSVNTKALDILGIAHQPNYLLGRNVQEFITPTCFFMGASPLGLITQKANTNQQDELISCNGETLVANRVPISSGQQQIGWVVSFRRRNDFNTLTSQITQIRQHNDNLRVMSHEFANRLSTICGLIQIGAYDEAVKTIRREADEQQQLIDFISQTFHPKVIAGLLLGKYCRAKELGLNLEFDPMSHLHQEPLCMTSDELAAVLGNLLDNAFEATLKNPSSNKIISLLLTDNGEELVIEVADNGIGIPDNIAETLFTKGVSSKKQTGHGIGLYLVHQLVTQAHGSILIDRSEPQGTIFSIFIPKNPKSFEENYPSINWKNNKG